MLLKITKIPNKKREMRESVKSYWWCGKLDVSWLHVFEEEEKKFSFVMLLIASQKFGTYSGEACSLFDECFQIPNHHQKEEEFVESLKIDCNFSSYVDYRWFSSRIWNVDVELKPSTTILFNVLPSVYPDVCRTSSHDIIQRYKASVLMRTVLHN